MIERHSELYIVILQGLIEARLGETLASLKEGKLDFVTQRKSEQPEHDTCARRLTLQCNTVLGLESPSTAAGSLAAAVLANSHSLPADGL
jgi:hypothetical protein